MDILHSYISQDFDPRTNQQETWGTLGVGILHIAIHCHNRCRWRWCWGRELATTINKQLFDGCDLQTCCCVASEICEEEISTDKEFRCLALINFATTVLDVEVPIHKEPSLNDLKERNWSSNIAIWDGQISFNSKCAQGHREQRIGSALPGEN